MPEKYRTRFVDDGYDVASEYEDCHGNCYNPSRVIGRSKHTIARLFRLTSSPSRSPIRELVVLSPRPGVKVDDIVSENKVRFFHELYDMGIRFHDIETERIIVPLIQGNTYESYKPTSIEDILKLFASAIVALERCHAKNLIFLDLKFDNILYHIDSDGQYISHLIDGDLATTIGSVIDNDIFQKSTKEELDPLRRASFHIAPECWSLCGQPSAVATPAMDVYSLAIMIQCLLSRLSKSPDYFSQSYNLNEILKRCLMRNPKDRPTLPTLKAVITREVATLQESKFPTATPGQ